MKIPPDFPLDRVLDALPFAVSLVALPGARIVYSNPAFDCLLGYPPGHFRTVGHLIAEAGLHERQRAALRRHWDSFLPCRDGAGVTAVPDIEVDFRGGDGQVRTALHCGLVLHEHQLAVVICKDITDQKRDSLRLQEYAFLDPLTGIANRRALEACWHGAAAAPDARLAFLMLDLDGFKPINDVFGHLVGDAVLCAVASRLKGVVRDSDFVCRLGGDEFGLLLDAPGCERQMEDICQRIIGLVGEPMSAAGVMVRITASVGACVYPDQAANMGELLQRADLALYTIKRSGKGRWGWWTPALDDAPAQAPAGAGMAP